MDALLNPAKQEVEETGGCPLASTGSFLKARSGRYEECAIGTTDRNAWSQRPNACALANTLQSSGPIIRWQAPQTSLQVRLLEQLGSASRIMQSPYFEGLLSARPAALCGHQMSCDFGDQVSAFVALHRPLLDAIPSRLVIPAHSRWRAPRRLAKWRTPQASEPVACAHHNACCDPP
jgi:hypothetical protein